MSPAPRRLLPKATPEAQATLEEATQGTRTPRGRLRFDSRSSPSRAEPIPGLLELTCLTGVGGLGRDRGGGRVRWAGAETMKLQAHGTRRPVAAVAAGMRRNEWSRRAQL